VRDFEDSTLWHISAFERYRAQTGDSGFASLERQTTLPATLAAELSLLERAKRTNDVIAVLAACIRKRESALIMLRHRDLVWPLTLFPQQGLYHLPREIVESLASNHRDLEVLAIEPPGLRPPGHVMHERIAAAPGYRRLPPLLWAIAQHAPRPHLLDDIDGRAVYRITADFDSDGLPQPGALGPAMQRLRREVTSIDDIARWPGMDRERAARLLNGVYLQGGLIVLRNRQPASESHISGLLRRLRPGR
jgi:hypothetical protein